ncbi:MAG TPA: hypothetical protein VI316_00185 [Candidatus Dormibacteraeota bacterium]
MSDSRNRVDGSPARSRSLLLVAAGLALLTGAAGMVIALVHGQPSPPPSLAPAPTQQSLQATPRPVPSSPPPPAVFPIVPPPAAGVSLLWVTRPWEQVTGSLRLHALDWNGREVGTLEVPCAYPCFTRQSPDGQRLLIARGGHADILDVAGRLVGAVSTDAEVAWADDSRHLCLVRSVSQPSAPVTLERAVLELADPASGGSRSVATVAGTVWYSGAWLLRGCSVRSDRAVLVLQNNSVISGVRVVQLSTGRIQYSTDDLLPPPGPVCSPCHLTPPLIVSEDGGVAVENLASGTARRRDLSTGVTSAWLQLPLGEPTIALSWGNRLAVTAQRVVDVASGRALWRAPPVVEGVMTRPEGDDVLVLLAVAFGAEPQMRIVHPDGSSLSLTGMYLA